MGQLPPMIEMFKSLGIGLAVAVFVIFVLLTAYFQSPRLALISIGAVPGVLAGIATILYFTNTSLNIESFMGSIMCLGVSVSNSVMLVTFMDEHWKGGSSSAEAAIVGASDRLRPILMTACAMTVGMVPMALALERGSQMQAPLGRAVIGGLVMSTFATLLVVPSIFAIVIGRQDGPLAVDLPGRPRERALRPAGLRRAEARSPATAGPLDRRETARPRPGRRRPQSDGHEPRPRTAATRRSRHPPRPPKANRPARPEIPDAPAPSGPRSRIVPAGCRPARLFWLLAALAAPGCGGEPKIDVHERLRAPDRAADPARRSGTSSGSSGSRASSRATSARRSIPS